SRPDEFGRGPRGHPMKYPVSRKSSEFLNSAARRDHSSARLWGTDAKVPPSVPCPVRNRAASKGAAAVPLLLLLAALLGTVACTKDPPAATSKSPVTLDPDVFETDRPELFKTAKAITRALPTQIIANGTISPDVTRTIHVTSLGGGRVVDLNVKLGD